MLGLAVVALVLYGALADRTVFEGGGKVRTEHFGGVDAAVAMFLVMLFSLLVFGGASGHASEASAKAPSAADMIAGIVFSEVIFIALAVGPLLGMKLRGMNLREAFGLERFGIGAVFAGAFGLLLLAFPLITETLELARVLLAGMGDRNPEPQPAGQVLAGSASLAARIAVGVQAVFLAPVQEELIFRGYLYGVAKRYLGPAGGIVLVSFLFAAIHQHAPSFAGLFVLAVCLTLAYEWSGSIFVPMTMHAMFNSLTVINLLAGGSAQN